MKDAIGTKLRLGFGVRFFLGVAAVMAVMGVSVMEQLIKVYREHQMLPSGFQLNLMLSALSSDTVVPFLPIVAVLPFSGNYIDEIKSKFARKAMVRTGYGTYLLSSLITCFLCGGAVILLGVLLMEGFSALVLLPMEKAGEVDTALRELLWQQSILLFLNGGFWSIVGMTMSTIMESKYIAYASPFIFYYLLVILSERYFPKAFLLYPKNWITPEEWPFGCWGAAIYLLELTILAGLVFYIRGRRRLEQL